MEREEIKIGTPVIYWAVITEKGEKIDPLRTTISSEPWELGWGEAVCKIVGKKGGVSIKHLELITPELERRFPPPMKIIQVTDEMYNKLMALATEYVTQDSRATAKPYLFQIQTNEEVAAYEGSGEEYWFGDEGQKIDGPEEEKQTIINLKGEEWKAEEAEAEYEKLDEIDIEQIFEENGYRKLAVTTEYKYQNAFFTAKACQEHIKLNHYHYTEPKDFLNHAWRNPEMDLICSFFKHIVKQEKVQTS